MKHLLMKLSFLILAIATLWACDKSDLEKACSLLAIVDSEQFVNAPNDPFKFEEVKIEGDCLEITYSYGGGCEEVVMKIIGRESIMKSNPPQRSIRMSLDDIDNCEALITTTRNYDLTPFRESGGNEIILRLDGWDESISYKY